MNPAIEAWLESALGLTISLPGSLSLVVAAVILGILLTVRRGERLGVPPDVTLSNLTWVLAFALLGARLAHWLENAGTLSVGELFLVWRGGLSFYGGVFGGLFGALVAPGGRDRQWLSTSDAGAFGFAAGLVISHLGCFLNGDDFGTPTTAPWAVRFPAGSPAHVAHVSQGLIAPDAATSLPVHPTQVYEMAFGALLLLALRYLAAARPPPGLLLLAAVGGYASFRLVLERFREPSSPLVAELFSAGQVWSVLCLALVVLGFVGLRRRPRPVS